MYPYWKPFVMYFVMIKGKEEFPHPHAASFSDIGSVGLGATIRYRGGLDFLLHTH